MAFNIKQIASAQILALTLGVGSAYAQVAATDEAHHQGVEKVATPENLLPDGVDAAMVTNPFTGNSAHARKGTVAAMLHNVALLNTKLQAPELSEKEWGLVEELQNQITGLLPSLDVIGVFDLFNAEEWVSETQLGRTMTITLYLKENPSKRTESLKNKLKLFLANHKKNQDPKVSAWFNKELKPLI